MKRRLHFRSAELPESAEALQNPSRGWYQIYPFRVEQEADFQELIWCLKKEETCALVLLDIGAYKERDLDETALLHIRQIFAFFDGQKKDILLRIVYDREGKCIEHEPSLFSQILAHIKQVEAPIQEYRHRILLFEGMLVGNWGEMHGSRFLAKPYMQALHEALGQTAAGILRAVRQPAHWRILHPEPPSAGTTVALFNDAIFGSDTDLGTFAPEGYESDAWESPWSKERELAFEEQLGEFVPQCGEAVCGEAYPNETLASTMERLRRMHLTWLNGVYDARILDLWKQWVWSDADVWQGINGYDYIGRHLGYRFCIRSVAARSKKQVCELTLTVENVGFSGFYQEAEALLLLTDREGRTEEFPTDWDVRAWKSGQTQSLTWQIPCREGKIYLCVRRKWDRQTIRFANPSTAQGQVLLGEWKPKA